MLQDSFRHKGLRKQLIDELKTMNITDTIVLNAINQVPRHLFMDKSFEERAYENVPFPIERGQTISNPYTVAFQTSLLQLNKNDIVLEIGTGSGYQAAVLSLLCDKVYSIERHQPLMLKSKKILKSLNYNNIQLFFKDGFLGLPNIAPFDKILITAAVPELPNTLMQQLKIGGYIVLPLGIGDKQEMLRIQRKDKLTFTQESFNYFSFVPMLNGTVN